MNLFRTKSVDALINETKGSGQLKKVLGAVDLVSLGIGAIVGTGIFVVTGIAAARYAGPSVMVSFALASLTCVLAAFAYAEFASMIPVAGSAYTYAYASLGEFPAWIMAWVLILQYSVAISAIAIGWSGYFTSFAGIFGISLPEHITASFLASGQGFINLPAFLIIFVISALVAIGIRQSKNINNVIVLIKIAVILAFVAIAAPRINVANWTPFVPFGVKGITAGAALVFFAFIGFDAVSTAAEEVKNPQKNLPIGIIASLLIATVLYIAVSAVLTGVLPYGKYEGQAAPVAFALANLGYAWASAIITFGVLAAITSVLLVMILSEARIIYAIARDGLLPGSLCKLSAKTHSPVRSTIAVAIITSLPAAFIPIDMVAELTNPGTLAAFAMVSVSIMFLRRTNPDLRRPFKCPAVPFIPVMSVILCTYLAISLKALTWLQFIVWLSIGVITYFLYSSRNSKLGKNPEDT